MKLLSCLVSAMVLGGCAALINSKRPSYEGPIVKPLWTVSNLAFDTKPIIHESIIYIRARRLDKDEKLLYAFELKTGKQLWMSNFVPDSVKFIVGPLLFVTDTEGIGHSLNRQTGKDLAPPGKIGLLSATVVNDIVYSVWDSGIVSAADSPTHALWRAQVPMQYLTPPVIRSGNVYVGGRVEKGGLTIDCEVHAFDAKTGALRWKWASGPKGDRISLIAADADTAYVWYSGSPSQVVALDAANGKPRWTSKNDQYFPEGPILFDAETVVIRDRPALNEDGTPKSQGYVFRGVKRTTGEPLWESTTPWKYNVWTERDGLLFVADRQAHSMLNEAGDTSPDSWLTVVDIRTGRELWRSAKIDLGDFTEPAVADGIVVVGSWPYQFQNAKAGLLSAFHATRDGQ